MTNESLDGLRDVKVYQSKGGYRFSVDALLLFSFVNLPRVKSIADLGAGSGIIGLLLAKKYPKAEVILIELQKNLVRLAERNAVLNGLEDRVRVINTDVKTLDFSSEFEGFRASALPNSYDLVVSNPPFRKVKTGRISFGDEKAIARHELSLPLDGLTKAASALLKHHGRFCVIHLPERLTEIISSIRKHALEPKRLRFVHSTMLSEAKMVLIEAVKGAKAGLKTEQPLIIYNEDGSRTKEMNEMYGQ